MARHEPVVKSAVSAVAISLIFRLFVSVIFFVTAIPKLLKFGKDPIHAVQSRIIRKKSTWVEMEMTGAYFTWTKVFGYPSYLMQPVGASMIASIILLNLFPPPSTIGVMACSFFIAMLGGAIYTWFVQYQSPKHAVMSFVTLMALTIVSCEKADPIRQDLANNSWRLTLFKRVVGPILLGFFGGPLFVYLGRLEAEGAH